MVGLHEAVSMHWRRQLWSTGAHAPWSLRMYTNLAISIYIPL